jgi:DeoR family transcriptional regulator, aga operon transcriptional repressor
MFTTSKWKLRNELETENLGHSFKKGVMVNDQDVPMTMLNAAAERVLLIDSSKIGSEALYHLCPLDNCSLVITDGNVDAHTLRRLQKYTNVIVAD